MERSARRALRCYLPLLCALLALYPTSGPIADAGYAERLPWHSHVQRISAHLHAYDLVGHVDADSTDVGAAPGEEHGAADAGGMAWAGAALIAAVGLFALVRARPARPPSGARLFRGTRPPCALAAA